MSEVAVQADSLPVTNESLPAVSTPDDLLAIAVQRGASVDELEALYNLKMRVEADEARKAFFKAFAKFKAECPTVERTAYSEHNNFWHETIAGIAGVSDPLLAKNGLSYSWKTEQIDGLIHVHFDLKHRDGHTERTTLFSAPDNTGGKNSIQGIGSAVEYLRRYTMRSGLGVSSHEKTVDPDGNANVKTIAPPQQTTIKRILEDNPELESEFMARLKEGDVERIEDIPSAWFGKLIEWLRDNNANS